jgi:hypothetical protein
MLIVYANLTIFIGLLWEMDHNNRTVLLLCYDYKKIYDHIVE